MSEFELKREKWLNEVANGCHSLAIAYEENPDFYVFQSTSNIQNPDLLIIGANPGRYETYKDRIKILKENKDKERLL